jgi:hypothetical protein
MSPPLKSSPSSVSSACSPPVKIQLAGGSPSAVGGGSRSTARRSAPARTSSEPSGAAVEPTSATAVYVRASAIVTVPVPALAARAVSSPLPPVTACSGAIAAGGSPSSVRS